MGIRKTKAADGTTIYCIKDVFEDLGVVWKSSKLDKILDIDDIVYTQVKGDDGTKRFAFFTTREGVKKLTDFYGKVVKETTKVRAKADTQHATLESLIKPDKKISRLQIKQKSDKILANDTTRRIQETARIQTRALCQSCAENLIRKLNVDDASTKGVIYNLVYDSLYSKYKSLFKVDFKRLAEINHTSALVAAEKQGEAVSLYSLAEALFSDK